MLLPALLFTLLLNTGQMSGENRPAPQGLPPMIESLLSRPDPLSVLQIYPHVSFDTPEFHRQVQVAEALVSRQGPAAFVFAQGQASLQVEGRTYAAGRFDVPSLGQLKAQAKARRRSQAVSPQTVNQPRLSILLGASPLTDVQYLEAHADGDTLFQLASQFNGLEATSPQLTEVSHYFFDRTQGPLGVLPAFPGALLRHYAAPAADTTRFVQTAEHQVNFLADVLTPELGQVQAGYLLSQNIRQPDALASQLSLHFDKIRIGLHRDLEVVGPGAPRLDQVLTSTLAGGGYSRVDTRQEPWLTIQRQLLRAAYLGTLLAALESGKHKVVLTAIGGGVFANPHRLIWEAVLWSLDQVQPYLGPESLQVILNLRSFEVPAEDLRLEAHKRHGRLVQLSP